jgi:hypothetical protein
MSRPRIFAYIEAQEVDGKSEPVGSKTELKLRSHILDKRAVYMILPDGMELLLYEQDLREAIDAVTT